MAQHQHDVYHWDWEKEKYIVGSGLVLNGGLLLIKAKLPRITDEQILQLNAENLNALDRTAIDNISETGELFSDIISYGSVVIPFAHYFSHHGKDEDWAVFGMAAEVYLINASIVDGMKVSFRRSRPFTYNTELSVEERNSKSARFSFPSGHTSNAAAFAFFSAKVFSDLHPESKWKPYVWGTAVVLPVTTAYLRYQSGNHFPTDLIAGYIIGASVGYLVPTLHKKLHKDLGLNLYPLGNGLALELRF